MSDRADMEAQVTSLREENSFLRVRMDLATKALRQALVSLDAAKERLREEIEKGRQ